MAHEDTDIHYADTKGGGLSTLCSKPIPPAKTSMKEKEITCETCNGKLKFMAIPDRPNYPNPGRRR
jgi:DNA-directed RNA polymerase subunit RPC12/RpoP